MSSKRPPSKDSPSFTPAEARSRMTRIITEISMGIEGDARSVLDRYLTMFNRRDEGLLPVNLQPHSAEKLPGKVRCRASNRHEVLFHTVGTMVKLYWAFAESPTIHTQREWDAVARVLQHVASKGLDNYVAHGTDSTGYWLMSDDQDERLSGQAEKEEKRRRG